MSEALRAIPGPQFLVIFGLFCAIAIWLAKLWVDGDGSDNQPLPEPTRLDTTALATLRGGWQAVIRATVFSLWQQKLVSIGKDERGRTELKSAPPSGTESRLSAVEEALHSFLQQPRRPDFLFKSAELQSAIEGHLQPVYRELTDLRLIRGEAERGRAWRAAWTVGGVFVVVGGGKLLLGIENDRPWSFLALELFAAAFFLHRLLLKPQLTTQGRRYLHQVEEHFAWLRTSVQAGKQPEGLAPGFAVALFGAGMLGGITLYDPYSDAFHRSASASAGYTGGCGGGSTSSASDGGGGDGGDGGGGCGGCGGGD